MRWIILLLLTNIALAEIYFVAENNCSDSNQGTNDEPWCTIQHAADTAVAGDIVYVREGEYDEHVTIRNSGSESNHIIFAGYYEDDKPLMRGFDTGGQDFIKIIGFEIINKEGDRFGIYGTGSNNCEYLHNYVHNTDEHTIRIASWSGVHTENVIFRGNEMYYGACLEEGACNGNGYGAQVTDFSNILFEYNHLHRVADFANFHGDHVIVRNNYMHDFANEYWPEGPGDGLHCDMFQPTGVDFAPSKYQVYESNFMGDNVERNSHILQMRSPAGLDDHHILFRGNVGYNHGSYAMQCAGVDNVYYYSNTIDEMLTKSQTGGSWIPAVWGYNNELGNNPTEDNLNFNNIVSDNAGRPIYFEEGAGNSVDASHNLCYDTYAVHDSCVSEDDPQYVDKQNREYWLRSNSAARDIGRSITVTMNSGTGTEIEVEQADLFIDGFGMTPGDRIFIGTDEARIVEISENTIMIDESISWEEGEPVYWRTESTDVGAYPYKESFDIEISVEYDGQTITADVNDPSLVRFVEFIVDGAFIELDFDTPYEYEHPNANHIKAIARPLYADKNLGYAAIYGECMPVHPADIDPCDKDISTEELFTYIQTWLEGDAELMSLLQVIEIWKE